MTFAWYAVTDTCKLVPAIKWPVYSLADPKNYVFEAASTGLSYVEKDLYRVEAINYWIKSFATVFGQ